MITSVGQEYESTEGRQDYKTNTEIIYREQEQPMDIRKSNNFKDRKPKCFNYNKYRHIAKECQSRKKKHKIRKYFKCDKEEHIARDYKGMQSMKKQKVQEESDNEDNNKETKKQSFGDDLK